MTTEAVDFTDPELPDHLIELAGAVNKLGEALIARTVDHKMATELTEAIAAMTERVETIPTMAKLDKLQRRNRISTFLETGSWPDPPADGSQMEFDPMSVVGGELNPFNIGAEYYRDGDEAVGRVSIGRCFEGPPERVHGGIICAIFDEVMGSVFRATGTASAFTGELTVRFVGPAPLMQDLEFRARLVKSDGRKRLLEGQATGPDGEFASATATFIEMRPEHFS